MKFLKSLSMSLGLPITLVLGQGPCDIYEAAKTPCVAAHSTVRALFSAYAGSLYEVKRHTDNETHKIGLLAPGGLADSAEQDTFCGNAFCSIVRIFDQSTQGNHLNTAPAGGNVPSPDRGVNATRHKISLNGHFVYGAFFEGGMGYRNDETSGVAVADEPESLYAVFGGRHFNEGCCFDYGNAETNNDDTGAGSMEAIYFGNSSGWGRGAGNGPWIMADLEDGLWAGNERVNPDSQPIHADFVTAMVKGKPGGFALKGGTAGFYGGPLKQLYNGPRPAGYNPMKKQGAIILGIGGDNSDRAIGTFYEGCMTSGFSTDEADNAVQENIIAAGYGKY